MIKGEGNNRYDELASKILDGTVTESEKREYIEWLNGEDGNELDIPQDFASDRKELENRILSKLQKNINSADHLTTAGYFDQRPSVNKDIPKFLRSVAAAIILLTLFGAVAYLWINPKINRHTLAEVYSRNGSDVLPGRQGAVLTLANGQQLVLDSLGNGVIATQGETAVMIRNHQLIYNASKEGSEVFYNTMITPKGRQYQLELPDGSKVWLNAASSITYPTVFVGKERNVRVTGEAYFEIAKKKEKPFIVDVDGRSTVQVLGTHFNVSSYADDGSIKTTLLEGSVKMTPRTDSAVAVNSYRQGASPGSGRRARPEGKLDRDDHSVILKPGQQAQQTRSAENITVNTSPDIELAMAWKEGYFQFNETSLQTAFRQLERWYDIDVVYEGAIPSETFIGQLPRNAPLSQILRVLAKTQVSFRIEGKKLIVSGSEQ